jgi:hypothetical protein
MSINTSEGNSRYLGIIRPFAEEVIEFGTENQSEVLINEGFFMRDKLHAVAERYGAGSIFPMASEKIIEIVNIAFDGELRVESKAAQDINDGTDVKTAFVQTNQNSRYSSISGLKGKCAGIRAIAIHDYSQVVKFKYLVIPSECILNDLGERQDSISINYDSEGEISIDSFYWSTQCSFYDFCMLPETAFIHNFLKNEEIRKTKLTQRRTRIFKETKNYMIENQVSLTATFESKLIPMAEAFYNTKECNNEYKNFTPEQVSELSQLSIEIQETKRLEEKSKIYDSLISICSENTVSSYVELLTVYFGDKTKAKNSSWFSAYDGYYFGEEKTKIIKDILEINKENRKIDQFKELRNVIRKFHITSITELEREKVYPASRLKKNYDNNSFYFENIIPDWKDQVESLFIENKR